MKTGPVKVTGLDRVWSAPVTAIVVPLPSVRVPVPTALSLPTMSVPFVTVVRDALAPQASSVQRYHLWRAIGNRVGELQNRAGGHSGAAAAGGCLWHDG